MSEQTDDQGESGQPRDGKGRFAPKKQSDDNGRSQPRDSDYTKMNSLLAKQLNLTDKLADFQSKYDPSELFSQLSFMADNVSTQPTNGSKKGGLPPNEKIAPISPPQPEVKLPGTQLHEPILDEQNFSVSFAMNPRDLINPNRNKKQKE